MGTHYTWKCIIHGKCSSHRPNIQCPKGKNLQSQTALLSFSAKKGKKLAWQPCSWRPHFLRAPGGHCPLKCCLQGGTRSDGTGWVIASPGNKSNDPSPIPLIGKLPLPFLSPSISIIPYKNPLETFFVMSGEDGGVSGWNKAQKVTWFLGMFECRPIRKKLLRP